MYFFLDFVLVDALVVMLVDELGFVLIDALVLVLIRVLDYLLVEALNQATFSACNRSGDEGWRRLTA